MRGRREHVEQHGNPSDLRSFAMKRRSLLQLVRSYPALFGIFVGAGIVGSIIVIDTWFPHVGDYWTQHDDLVRSIVFTTGLFGVLVGRYWNLRRQAFFRLSMATFFLAHSAGVLLYRFRVHPLGLRQWILLLAVESLVFVFYVDWATRRFGRLDRHQH